MRTMTDIYNVPDFAELALMAMTLESTSVSLTTTSSHIRLLIQHYL